MKKIITLFLVFSLVSMSYAQDVYKFAVHLTDKDHTPFNIENPSAFLSQRSIDRRAKYHIDYNEADLPIDPVYIQDVLNATENANLIIQVKWMNTIIISLHDSANIELINKIPIVESTECVFNPNLKSRGIQKFEKNFSIEDAAEALKSAMDYDSAYYGGGWIQIHQMMGEKLHQQAYTGQGMVIAVLDAGFINADSLQIFDRLWDNGQILGTANFVEPDSTVFANHTHGTMVLSTMGGYWEENLVGTAPDASYWLLRTEDGATENIIEEYNWVAGAAFADSVGADVLNTSLGYIDFDDSSYDHTYDDLDGNTTVITRGANMAFARGMLAVNSAGNSGNSSWRYLGAPADAYGVFSVGAVDADGLIAGFSSHGFPWSNDVKPNVVARGAGAFVASPYSNSVVQGNGTSFSSPIMAGMVTSLWSSNPAVSPAAVKRAIQQSADRFLTPDTLYGYGMPNFQQALSVLAVEEQSHSQDAMLSIYPNPTSSLLNIFLNTIDNSELYIKIYNMQSVLVVERKIAIQGDRALLNVSSLASGIYIVEIQQDDHVYQTKLNKI